jgi:hypothetical protein
MTQSLLLARRAIPFPLAKRKERDLLIRVVRDVKVVSASPEPLRLPKKRRKKTVMMASNK